MHIQKIERARPLKLEAQGKNSYLTHSVWVEGHAEPLALIGAYGEEDLHVYVARFDLREGKFIDVPDEVSQAVEAYLVENPIEMPTLEQLKEVASLG